jgi:hypothetical protein
LRNGDVLWLTRHRVALCFSRGRGRVFSERKRLK